MERDLMVMIYGAIMGVAGSIITSIVTVIFQLWIERREYERRQSEESRKRLTQIHLPADEDIRTLNADQPEAARTSAEAGAILVSLLLSATAVYQTRDVVLGFLFAASLSFLVTHRLTRFLRRR